MCRRVCKRGEVLFLSRLLKPAGSITITSKTSIHNVQHKEESKTAEIKWTIQTGLERERMVCVGGLEVESGTEHEKWWA